MRSSTAGLLSAVSGCHGRVRRRIPSRPTSKTTGCRAVVLLDMGVGGNLCNGQRMSLFAAGLFRRIEVGIRACLPDQHPPTRNLLPRSESEQSRGVGRNHREKDRSHGPYSGWISRRPLRAFWSFRTYRSLWAGISRRSWNSRVRSWRTLRPRVTLISLRAGNRRSGSFRSCWAFWPLRSSLTGWPHLSLGAGISLWSYLTLRSGWPFVSLWPRNTLWAWIALRPLWTRWPCPPTPRKLDPGSTGLVPEFVVLVRVEGDPGHGSQRCCQRSSLDEVLGARQLLLGKDSGHQRVS